MQFALSSTTSIGGMCVHVCGCEREREKEKDRETLLGKIVKPYKSTELFRVSESRYTRTNLTEKCMNQAGIH